MRCPSCSQVSPADARFCMHCGGALGRSCASCQSELPPEAQFCPKCGRSVETDVATAAVPAPTPRDYTPKHLAERILRSKAALEGERKQVTVLFADVARSMELAEELDPETWHGILDRFFQILAEGVHRFEGTINQYTGDGIMALFGAPIAHEDHAHRACFAALHLRDKIREYTKEVRARHGVSFGVRIGINSGDVVVGKIGDDLRMDYTAQGHVVGLAQRMETLAESGRVCVSEHTSRLIEGYFELADQGQVNVKGVSAPVGLYELEGVGPFRTRLDRSRARGFSMFVGRDNEMQVLENALEDARQGRARVVGVVAEAGVGKSRLCAEFVERCRAREIAVLEAHCPAHGRTIPLLPVLELLRAYFGIDDADAPRIAREKIAGRLLLLNRDLDKYLPLVWDLMRVPDPDRPVEELDAATQQRQLGDVTRSVVRLRSEHEPAIFLIDDLHWVDAASDAFFAQLIDAARDTRTLIVVNFRPEYRADWMQRGDYLQIPLSPLDPGAIRSLLVALLGDDPSVAELPDAIHARAAGNPFFTEEVVQSLIESGSLEGERGAFRLVRPIERLEIPDTVQSVLAARIDRLQDLEKRVLQTAAVIDRDFSRPLLGEISDVPESDLDASLRALCDGDFLYQREMYPVAEYGFKHPLTHEVAYASQLGERRRKLHAALARVLESADVQPSLLAHHWDEAGEPGPAVHWHREAAEELGFAAQAEMLRHWHRASELLDGLPETDENLIAAATARAQILWIETRGPITPERAEKLYGEALAIGARTGDGASLAGAHRAYSTYRLYSGQSGAAKLAEDAVREADEAGDVVMQVASRFAGTVAHYFGNDVSRCLDHADAGIALCGDDFELGSAAVGFSPRVFLGGMRGAALAALGRLDEAAAAVAEVLRDPLSSSGPTQAICAPFAVRVDERRGVVSASPPTAARSMADWDERFSQLDAGSVHVYHSYGVTLALNSQWDAAIAAFDRSLSVSTRSGTFLQQRALTLAWKARALIETGDYSGAARLLEEAIERAQRLEQALSQIELFLTRARLRRETKPEALEPIESDIDAAAAIVERTGALGHATDVHEARATLSRLRGDEAGWRRELELARDLARDMGAGPRADRIDGLLSGVGA